MNFFLSFAMATKGWVEIITGRDTAVMRFDSSRFGLLTAISFYLLVVLLTLALQTVQFGPPAPMILTIGLLIQALPVLAVSIVTPFTFFTLRLPGHPRELLVPVIYLLGFLFLIRLFASYFDMQANIAILGLLGFFLFRAARIVTSMKVMPAIAYAVLNIVLLVAMPLALYMLLAPGPGPI